MVYVIVTFLIQSALCVFNYNIGPFTFVSGMTALALPVASDSLVFHCAVFAYVGGLYFFLRTTLNAFIKCIRVVLFISYKYTKRLTGKFNPSVAGNEHLPLTDSDARQEPKRVSLLASLPKDYLGASTTFKEQSAIN